MSKILNISRGESIKPDKLTFYMKHLKTNGEVVHNFSRLTTLNPKPIEDFFVYRYLAWQTKEIGYVERLSLFCLDALMYAISLGLCRIRIFNHNENLERYKMELILDKPYEFELGKIARDDIVFELKSYNHNVNESEE